MSTAANPSQNMSPDPTSTPAGIPSRSARARERRPHYRLTWPGVVRSEWIKTLGLRSTWWTLGVALVVMVAFSALIAVSLSMSSDQMGGDIDAFRFDAITAGLSFGQLAVAVLGALVITGEFSTGSIRSTFAAVPGRTGVVLAKAVVLTVLVAVTGAVSTALAYVVGIPAFSGTSYSFDASDPTTWRILLGTVLYLVTLALFSLGVGAIVRNSTGAIFTLVAIVFVLPMVVSIAGAFEATKWIATAGEYLPANAGGQLLATATDPDALSPWQGYGVFAAWTVVALVVGIVLTKKRDA
ncbi:ABC transporter permease [Actinomyces polynesiensis]|uniref:ABC transporter permease n=1 Tax=Actinomyces polynesiensis TaxID=1325934 RepID=UPI000694C140|nr:ABC transporter permease subunit [Actinomyces polynesiensis]